MKSVMSFLVFVWSLVVSAEGLAAPLAKVQNLINSYYSQQAVWNVLLHEGKTLPRPLPEQPPENPPHPPHYPDECRPNYPQDCVEAICNKLSRFYCDDRNELLEITRQCRNVKGDCIRTICNRVSRFECDEKYELLGVADMCRGLFDVSCIDYVCSRLSRFECDELSELREIAYQCR